MWQLIQIAIEQDTKNIIDEYIRDFESIILAIVPANIDPATSEALKIARSYDKNVLFSLTFFYTNYMFIIIDCRETEQLEY